MARSNNPSVWIEKRRTKGGEFKYRVRAEADGRSLPSGPWMPRRTWAEEEKAKLLAKLWAGEREDATRRRQTTWDSFRADYERRRKAKVPETWARFDKYALNSFGALGKASGRFLQAIDKQLVDDWVVALISMKDAAGERAYANTTIAMWFRSLTTALNDALAAGLIKKNPCDDVEPPSEDEGGRVLKEYELKAIFEAARPELWRAGQWALNCGPRLGEVVIFDWAMVEDVRFHGEAVWFGRIPAHLRKARQKVKKDCRFPINAEARELMGQRQRNGLVFPYVANTLQHQFVEARAKAGVPGASFHWLRHTFATRFLARGGHIEDLLETKLWADYKSLLRYVHLDDEILLSRFQAAAQPLLTRPVSAQIAEEPVSS